MTKGEAIEFLKESLDPENLYDLIKNLDGAINYKHNNGVLDDDAYNDAIVLIADALYKSDAEYEAEADFEDEED